MNEFEKEKSKNFIVNSINQRYLNDFSKFGSKNLKVLRNYLTKLINICIEEENYLLAVRIENYRIDIYRQCIEKNKNSKINQHDLKILDSVEFYYYDYSSKTNKFEKYQRKGSIKKKMSFSCDIEYYLKEIDQFLVREIPYYKIIKKCPI